MINIIWAGMIAAAVIVAFFTGKVEAVAQAGLNGAKDAVTLVISLLGMMCLWTGFMNIAQKSGLVTKFSRLLRPVIRLLFPDLPPESEAAGAVVSNMVANIFGLSNAATPLGLKAMKELDRRNGSSPTASDSMCMLVVINTASIQLIPSTVIAIRAAAGSADPFGIIVPVWISSLCAVCVGVTAVKLMQGRTAADLRGSARRQIARKGRSR